MEAAIEWIKRECLKCGKSFDQRQVGKFEVYQENCAECRQRLGHKTAVDWIRHRRFEIQAQKERG